MRRKVDIENVRSENLAFVFISYGKFAAKIFEKPIREKFEFVALESQTYGRVSGFEFTRLFGDSAIAGKNSVDTEHSVVQSFAVIAAVAQAFFVDFKSVIGKLPYKAAHNAVGRTECFEVFFQTSRAVAHIMCVLAKHERTCFARVDKVFVGNPIYRRVHAADHIDRRSVISVLVAVVVVRARAFVMNGTRIDRLYPKRGALEVRAVTGLVAERPYNHARTIALNVHVAFLPLENVRFEQRIFRDTVEASVITGSRAARNHAVSFDVRLAHNVKTVLVAKFVKLGTGRVMRSPDRVDIRRFHQRKVAFHILDRYRRAVEIIEIVAVYSVEFDRLAVEKQYSVLDFHRTYTYFFADRLTVRFYRQIVQKRIFRAP